MDMALKCIIQQCSHWIQSFWLLADLKLAIVAACVEFLITRDSLYGGHGSSDSFNKKITGAKNIHSKMMQTLDAGSRVDSRAKALLGYLDLIQPIPLCQIHQCTCLSSTDISIETPPTMKTIYAGLVHHLEHRRQKVFDSGNALEKVSSRMENAIRDWTATSFDLPSSPLAGAASRYTEKMAYILSCPELHPVSYGALEQQIMNSPGEKGLQVSAYRRRSRQLHNL